MAKATLSFILLSVVVVSVILSPVVGDIVAPPPSGSCQFSQSTYSPGDTIVLYVHADTQLQQPVLLGNTPQGQVTFSLGSSLSPGDYSFPVGTAAPPSGYRQAALYAYYTPVPGAPGVTPTGSFVEVADCGGYYVQAGPTSTTQNCTGGQNWNGAQCVCPSGQTWNGYQCVAPPPPTPTCPSSMSDPSVINISSGTIISELLSDFIGYGGTSTPAHIPLAQDSVTIQPVAQSSISSVETKVTEDDSSNIADFHQTPTFATRQPDGSYTLAVTVQDVNIYKPMQVAWDLVSLAASAGSLAGNAAATALDNAISGLGLLQGTPPDVQLSLHVIVHYQNGLDCSYGGYPLPTFAKGVRENWKTIVDWVNSHFGWMVSLHSNADLLAVDSSGHRLGAVYQNGVWVEDVNEISGASYSGHGTTPQILALPQGDYSIEVEDNAPGQYLLSAASASNNWNVQTDTGQTQTSSTDTYSLSGSTITATSGAQWSWTNFGLAAVATVVLVFVTSEVILRRHVKRRRR